MPVRFERDDARRRVMVTVQGAFQTSDMLAVIARQSAEHTWSYGKLVDLRSMTGHPTLPDLREVMGQVEAHRPPEQPRGPVAILATDPVLYGVACTYAALGHAKVPIQVFRDLDEADVWLAAEMSPRN